MWENTRKILFAQTMTAASLHSFIHLRQFETGATKYWESSGIL